MLAILHACSPPPHHAGAGTTSGGHERAPPFFPPLPPLSFTPAVLLVHYVLGPVVLIGDGRLGGCEVWSERRAIELLARDSFWEILLD